MSVTTYIMNMLGIGFFFFGIVTNLDTIEIELVNSCSYVATHNSCKGVRLEPHAVASFSRFGNLCMRANSIVSVQRPRYLNNRHAK